LANISQGGVCLNLARRFEPGTGLTIELPDTDSHGSYAVLAKVMHVRRQENGSWLLGCKFIGDLSEDEMARLLHSRPRAGDAPKQRISGVQLQLEIALRTTFNCVIPQVSATNRWPLVSGSLAMLQASDGAGKPWKLKVRVRQCVSRGEGWDLACTLVKASSHDLVRALGGLLTK
jgi:hypothetical protein